MDVGRQSFLDLLALYSNIELIVSTGPLLSDGIRMNDTRIIRIVAAHSERLWQTSMWIDAIVTMVI
jgi:hypothetical protein